VANRRVRLSLAEVYQILNDLDLPSFVVWNVVRVLRVRVRVRVRVRGVPDRPQPAQLRGVKCGACVIIIIIILIVIIII
jgi:hypothetical protein